MVGQAGQEVLEDPFEAQELRDAPINTGMEPQAALVGTDGAVELNAVAVVDLSLALVIDPCYPELNGPVGSGQTLQNGVSITGRRESRTSSTVWWNSG